MMEGRKFDKNGATYEVRFFDPESFFDLRDLREIVQSPGVQQWMSSVRNMSHKHYGRWMKERGENNNFLFAIAGDELGKPEAQRVQGFIYIYPSELMNKALEISYAKRPGAPSGLITPATVEASKIVREMSGDIKIVAEIERGNDPSITVIEKAGFVKIRDFDRYGNAIWKLDWGKI